MPGIDRALAGWMDAYAAPEANAATLHCDRHDPVAVAFRFTRPRGRMNPDDHVVLAGLEEHISARPFSSVTSGE
jgi:hypothetical protein